MINPVSDLSSHARAVRLLDNRTMDYMHAMSKTEWQKGNAFVYLPTLAALDTKVLSGLLSYCGSLVIGHPIRGTQCAFLNEKEQEALTLFGIEFARSDEIIDLVTTVDMKI